MDFDEWFEKENAELEEMTAGWASFNCAKGDMRKAWNAGRKDLEAKVEGLIEMLKAKNERIEELEEWYEEQFDKREELEVRLASCAKMNNETVERNIKLKQKLEIALELIHKLRQLNKWNKGVSDMIMEALGKIDQNDPEVKKV
jgi:chromosome segregation ATPase